MADQKLILEEGSPAAIAYKLFHDLKMLGQPANATREWFLDLYGECIEATKDRREFRK